MLIRRQPWRGVRNSSGRANTSAWNALCKMYEMQFSKCRNTVERVAVAHQERGLCPAGCYRPREAARTIWKLRIPPCTPSCLPWSAPNQSRSGKQLGTFGSFFVVLAASPFLKLAPPPTLPPTPLSQLLRFPLLVEPGQKRLSAPLSQFLKWSPFPLQPHPPPWALPIAIVCEIFLSPCKRPVCGPSQCVAAHFILLHDLPLKDFLGQVWQTSRNKR